MLKKLFTAVALVIIMLLAGGCLDLQIQTDADYPAKAFKAAWSSIDALHAKDPKRKGPVSKVNFMVYIGKERTLVRFALPKDQIPKNLDNIPMLEKKDLDEIKDKCKDLDKLRDVQKLGPGLVADVKVAEDDVHLLIWLD